jgi:hypothetical protein
MIAKQLASRLLAGVREGAQTAFTRGSQRLSQPSHLKAEYGRKLK